MSGSEIVTILTNYREGSAKFYDILVHHLSDPSVKDDILLQLLTGLKDCTTMLGREFEHLVGVILSIDWLGRDSVVVREYQRFIINLVSAHTDYLKACLRMIVKKFVPKTTNFDTETASLSDQIRLKHEEDFMQLHWLLKNIGKLVPMSPVMLLPLLSENFPFIQKDSYVHGCYINNLLNLSSYMPSQRFQILELIVDRMTKLDVRSPRDVIEETDCDDENDDMEDIIFDMENLENASTEVKKNNAMKHKEADRLDVMMEILFQYIHKVCHNNKGQSIDWDSTKQLYRDLLKVFDRIILPTHASCHIQFLMFYICQFHNSLVTGYLDYLWKKVCDPNTQSIFRQATVAYIASLLARAKYIPLDTVKNYLELLVSWTHNYIRETADSDSKADVVHHGPFYSVCQSIFYIFAFKHKELLSMSNGYKYCQDLHLQSIVTCRLNPLRVCLPIVVRTFASIMRRYQLAYCDSVMEHNRRMFLPEAGVNRSQPSVSYLTNMNPLDSFFPFDPYLLRRSGSFIHDIYQEYENVEDEVEGRLLEDEDDGCADETSKNTLQDAHFENFTAAGFKMATSPNDLLMYSISPGFKHV